MADFLPAFEKMIEYDCESGNFKWLLQRGRAIKPGDTVKGSVRPDGYISICVNGKSFLAHRLAWRLAHGAFPDGQIDHIDGDKENNRISNLRLATPSQNQWNKGLQKNSSSGFKGVSLHRQTGLFRARLKCDSKEICVGYYKTPQQAHEALTQRRSSVHGTFARC